MINYVSKDTEAKKVEPEKRGCMTASSPIDEVVHKKPDCKEPFNSLLNAAPGTDKDGSTSKTTVENTKSGSKFISLATTSGDMPNCAAPELYGHITGTGE